MRLGLAGEIGQVRDVMTAITGHDAALGSHRSADEAVRAAQAEARALAGDEQPGTATPSKEE